MRTQLADSAEAAKKLADADKDARQGARRSQGRGRARSPRRRGTTPSGSPSSLRAQADAELERIKAQGGQQVQLLRQQLIRELRPDLGAESVQRAGDLVRDARLRSGRAVRDGRPLPRRAGRDGAVDRGLRGRASRRICAPPAARRWPRWSSKFDEVAGGPRRRRTDHAGRRSRLGGQTARS